VTATPRGPLTTIAARAGAAAHRLAGRVAGAAWAETLRERSRPTRHRVAAAAGRYPPRVRYGALLGLIVLAVGGALLGVRHEAARPAVAAGTAAGAADGSGATGDGRAEVGEASRAGGAGKGKKDKPAGKGNQPPKGRTAPNPVGSLRPDKAKLLQHALDGAAKGADRRKPFYKDGKAQELARNHDPVLPAARTAGVNDTMRQGPFPPGEFTVRNLYQGPVGTSWYLVYAGSTGSAAGTPTGGVRVLAQSPDGSVRTLGTFTGPAGTPALRAESASGTVLTLAATDGQRLRFDLATLRYR
jgi:hypothetical protein